MKKQICLAVVLLFCFSSILSAEGTDLVSLIEKGETLIKQGSYPAGIAVLETVLTKDPKNARVLSALLAAYDTYSQKLISENNFSSAETYLKKMDDISRRVESIPATDPTEGGSKSESRIKREIASAKAFLLSPDAKKTDLISLNAGRENYNEAVNYFNKRQYDIAESLLKESVKLDQSNAYAYELLGEIANLNQRLDEAQAYYKQAFLINPDPALRAKYEKVTREKSIDKTQQQYEDEHFIIRYRRNDSIEGSDIRQYLRDSYKTISQSLAHYPKYKIPVVLYDREEYQNLMGSVPHWSGALYDGKIRIPVYLTGSVQSTNNYDSAELRKLIQHELTHAFILDLSQMKCPVWLNEGLAQYFEDKIKSIDLSILIAAARKNLLLKPDELMFQDISKVSSHERALLYYLESFSLISYILDHSKMYSIKQLLIELGKGTQFEPAFEKSFSRTFKDMASEWQAEISAKYGGSSKL